MNPVRNFSEIITNGAEFMRVSNGVKDLIKKFTPDFLLSIYHYFLAAIGAFFYGFPSRKLKVVGITGTKGKSTTVILAGKILEEALRQTQGEPFKVGWISSATIKIGEKEWLNPYHMTMPGRFFIQKLMGQMLNQGCQYCLIEVTSEGILQHRQKFIDFDTAILTNLRPEHIEAHSSFKNYRSTKGKLFQAVKKNHIINLDDKNSEYFLQFPAEKKIFYSQKEIRGPGYQLPIVNYRLKSDGIDFKLGPVEFNLKLLGQFNFYNVLSAISIALLQGINLETCKRALEKIKEIPGRMEMVVEKPFKVVVDLAHTPDSFEEVFKVVKKSPHNKIISIFGSAGGGRDKWKRPILGKIAANFSDFIIICNEDPYNENPEKIIEDIERGIKETSFKKENYLKIKDRKEAVREGLKLAQKNDIILILGKGTEQLLVIENKKIPWDDRKVVREELRLLLTK